MAATKLHDVESMIDWFMEMDTNKDNAVDEKELVAYYKQKGVSEEVIKVSFFEKKFIFATQKFSLSIQHNLFSQEMNILQKFRWRRSTKLFIIRKISNADKPTMLNL